MLDVGLEEGLERGGAAHQLLHWWWVARQAGVQEGGVLERGVGHAGWGSERRADAGLTDRLCPPRVQPLRYRPPTCR